MVMLLLSIANIASIVVATVIGVRVLRGNRFTLSGLAVAIVLVATVMWSVISLVGAQEHFTEGSDLPERALFWSAVLIAGVRSLVRVLENPAWSPRPRDIIDLIAHPAAMGVIAAIPQLHFLLVTADDGGNLSYAFGFWIHSAVGLALSVRPLTVLLDPRSRIPRDSARTRFVMIVSWALPAAGYLISALVWGPTGPNLAPAFLIVPVAMMGSAVVRDGLVDRLPLARGEVFEALAGAVFVTDSARPTAEWIQNPNAYERLPPSSAVTNKKWSCGIAAMTPIAAGWAIRSMMSRGRGDHAGFSNTRTRLRTPAISTALQNKARSGRSLPSVKSSCAPTREITDHITVATSTVATASPDSVKRLPRSTRTPIPAATTIEAMFAIDRSSITMGSPYVRPDTSSLGLLIDRIGSSVGTTAQLPGTP